MTCVVRRTKRDKHCSPDHQKTITTITHVTLSWKQRTSRFFTKLSTTHVILEATHVTLFDSDLLRVSQDSRSRTWSAPVDVKGEGDTMFSAWDCTCASFSDIAKASFKCMWQVKRFPYVPVCGALTRSPTSFAIVRSCAWYSMAFAESPCDRHALLC
jgi:hypothetical protein